MTDFVYSRDIPFEDDDPSVDQPDMKVNTNSIDDLINVDHYSFNQTLGGLHKQIQLPLRGGSPGFIPPGLIANEGTLYTKTVTSAPTLPDETGLFYTPDASTNQYQLTRTVHASIATFSTKPGWIFLPGGLLMQFGQNNASSAGNAITFPVQFTAPPYGMTLTANSGSPGTVGNLSYDTLTAMGAKLYTSGLGVSVFWVVIGK